MYCKYCKAIVTTGKYCSNCGKRVNSDLKEFRSSLRRRQKAFSNSKFKEDGPQGFQVACFAFDRAVGDQLPPMDIHNFGCKIRQAEEVMQGAEERADALYQKMMRLLDAEGYLVGGCKLGRPWRDRCC